MIQVYEQLKTSQGNVTIKFSTPFTNKPTIIVSPYFKDSQSQVGSIPTVTAVSKTECVITSANAASNYYVSVLAIDQESAVRAGSINKTASGELQIGLSPALSSSDPMILVTSFWNGATGGVGSIDTVDDAVASEFSVVSANAASNYFTNYIASDLGMKTIGVNNCQNGIVNKIGQGKMRVYFNLPFSAVPKVFVSPWYNDQNSGVANIETVTKITRDYFEFTSSNAGLHYFVNWLAVEEA
jgi:hypothetical protein|tara:strand:- start:1206 stop:1928 length:723 start_codon:yes stop_codon:yes gene_type:complete